MLEFCTTLPPARTQWSRVTAETACLLGLIGYSFDSRSQSTGSNSFYVCAGTEERLSILLSAKATVHIPLTSSHTLRLIV